MEIKLKTHNPVRIVGSNQDKRYFCLENQLYITLGLQ